MSRPEEAEVLLAKAKADQMDTSDIPDKDPEVILPEGNEAVREVIDEWVEDFEIRLLEAARDDHYDRVRIDRVVDLLQQEVMGGQNTGRFHHDPPSIERFGDKIYARSWAGERVSAFENPIARLVDGFVVVDSAILSLRKHVWIGAGWRPFIVDLPSSATFTLGEAKVIEKIESVDAWDGEALITLENGVQLYRGGSFLNGFVARIRNRRDIEEGCEPYETLDYVRENVLQPDEVRQAQADGRRVSRQGDWFFVETVDGDGPSALTRYDGVESEASRRRTGGAELNEDLNREGDILGATLALPPADGLLDNHIAEEQGVSLRDPTRVYVRGEVHHSSNDHRREVFHEWRLAVHNDLDAISYDEQPETREDFGSTPRYD